MVEWPEPNDDPNIPYVWGLGAYPLGNPTTDTRLVEPFPEVKDVPRTLPNEELVKAAVGTAIVLGLIGAYEGFTESESFAPLERILEGASRGVIYATGIGYIVSRRSK
jgi:hypothetical protein